MTSAAADYHLHTPLCRHAEGTPAEYAAEARRLGLPEIGFADHSPMPGPFDDWRMDRGDLPAYLESVEAARTAVPALPIRLGLEVDFLPDGRDWIGELSGMAPWDYLIGSVHYIGDSASRWDIDNPVRRPRYVATPGATEEIWEQYWRLFAEAARSRLFDILAHPDLPKKFGFRPPGDLRRFYEPAVAAIADADAAIEINTAGWHKDCAEQYPARLFLDLAASAGIPLVISSDAHTPADVGRDFDRATALAREAGFPALARFEGRRRRLVPLG